MKGRLDKKLTQAQLAQVCHTLRVWALNPEPWALLLPELADRRCGITHAAVSICTQLYMCRSSRFGMDRCVQDAQSWYLCKDTFFKTLRVAPDSSSIGCFSSNECCWRLAAYVYFGNTTWPGMCNFSIFSVQIINEKPNVIQEYENGKAIPNQQVISKLERALGVKLRGKKWLCCVRGFGCASLVQSRCRCTWPLCRVQMSLGLQ